MLIWVFFWNRVRGLRAARGWFLREGGRLRREETAPHPAAARGAGNAVGTESEKSHGGGGRAEHRSGPSSRLLLPEQILAELLRHQRLQPAPLARPLPRQPRRARCRGPHRCRRGRAALPAAGHVPRRLAAPAGSVRSLPPHLRRKGAAPTELSAPTGIRPLGEQVDASWQFVDGPCRPPNCSSGQPRGRGRAGT